MIDEGELAICPQVSFKICSSRLNQTPDHLLAAGLNYTSIPPRGCHLIDGDDMTDHLSINPIYLTEVFSTEVRQALSTNASSGKIAS